MQHVFLIGSKGIPAHYGGYETFVECLTKGKSRSDLHYHVACMGKDTHEEEYNNARLFFIKVPSIGPAKAIYYDVAAFRACIRYIRKYRIERPIVYVLTCRIGPFFRRLVRQVHRLGGKVYLNPDGHEWMRAKWSLPVRQYWKKSEKLMVKATDLVICDSLNIASYIEKEYHKYQPKTTYIAYGANIGKSALSGDDPRLTAWRKRFNIKPKEYYLVVGRFVPENNFEIMIREFLRSTTKKDLVLITNAEKNKFYSFLEKKYRFSEDKRVKFVGTVYDEELLKKIREEAFAYLHGHSVGGTNPSLLEALAATELNLLYDVGFNREVGRNSALYFTGEIGNLCALFEAAENLSAEERSLYAEKSTEEITRRYVWKDIIGRYEALFMEE